MKISIRRESLVATLDRMSCVVNRRTTVPVLANVKLSVAAGVLTVAGTDLDAWLTETPEIIDSPVEGACTVPCHALRDRVKAFPKGAVVTLEIEKGALRVRSGQSVVNLQTLPVEEWPEAAKTKIKQNFTLPMADIRELLARVSYAISTEETRYYLNGALFHVADGKLRAATTDGHRLAWAECALPDGATKLPWSIVPSAALALIRKFIAKDKDDLQLQFGKLGSTPGFIAIASGWTLVSKLIDGTFPDYSRICPTQNKIQLTVNRKAMASALTGVSKVSSERGHAVKLTLAPGKLQFNVRNFNLGDANDEIETDYNGAPLEIWFDARYLLDVLATGSDESVVFKFADPSSPALIIDRDGAASLNVLMPVRI